MRWTSFSPRLAADGRAGDTQVREINGDARLSAAARVAYLAGNLVRNVAGSRRLRRRSWRPSDDALAHTATSAASPVRLLMELFLVTELSRLQPRRRLRVLDIGCGSGRMRHVLAAAGFEGQYIGVDVDDRFVMDDTEGAPFAAEFVRGDAGTVPLDGRFDLILSVSALEHVADDVRLLRRLRGLLAPDGLQLHLVPSPWSLFAYLWHGYRQYGARAIAERFDANSADVIALGGLPSLLVHVLCITVCEMLMRWPVRRRAPGFYGRLARAAVRLDRRLPICPPTYAVVERRRGAVEA